MRYSKYFSTKQTPQSERIPGREDQVKNNAGGFVWAVDDWTRMHRFLILGTEGGSYYVGERELTVQNAEAVLRCIKADGPRVVAEIAKVSESGRAPKNDPALFALAMAASLGDLETRREALRALPRVARTGYHLFRFVDYAEAFRGWGRSMRRAIGAWFNDKGADTLSYQVIKYRQRGGWSMRDLLRLSHPKPQTPAHGAIYRWITQAEAGDDLPRLIEGFIKIQEAESERDVIALIEEYDLPWETVPTQFLGSARVWDALLPRLPMTALLRNLARMTANGLIVPLSNAAKLAAERITDGKVLQAARVHPIQVLSALATYKQGKGARGKLTWEPVSQIVDALDEAFYLSFGNVEPMGKRVVLALDVSSSMTWGAIAGVPGLTPRVASAAMAMVTARVEQDYTIVAFCHEMVPLEVSPRERLDDVLREIGGLRFGGTDCSLPMMWALGYDHAPRRRHLERPGYKKIRGNVVEADAFVVYTDSETWYGAIHPSQALDKYRRETGIPARLVVVGMTANQFSIADPNDPGMLDVVGFDTATPNLISDFVRGDL